MYNEQSHLFCCANRGLNREMVSFVYTYLF